MLGVRILGRFISGVDTAVLIRYVVCGTALLSNTFIYFTVKKMTGSRRWAYIGLVLSVFFFVWVCLFVLYRTRYDDLYDCQCDSVSRLPDL